MAPYEGMRARGAQRIRRPSVGSGTVVRTVGAAVVVLALALTGPVLVAPDAPASASDTPASTSDTPASTSDAATSTSATPAIHSPVPAPGELVPAGATRLAARISGEEPVVARFHVDGVAHDAPAGTRDAHGTGVAVNADLTPGAHDIRLEVHDATGTVTERTWRVTATERTVARHAGTDRIATAVAISRATLPAARAAESAVLARADDFADALAGVPLAAHIDGPLLLAHRSALPTATAQELTRVLVPGATVHLLGGEAALDGTVVAAVAELGFDVIRHAGADRFATAGVIARSLPSSQEAILASGVDFPDALAASAPAARDGIPVLLTAPHHLPRTTRIALAGRRTVTIAGGSAAVGPEVEHAVADLVPDVRRVAGRDRYATAAALLDAFYDDADGVSLASGTAFPDALAGARHAVALAQPLLLTASGSLPVPAEDRLRHLQPNRIAVYGGTAAVSDLVAAAATQLAESGLAAPRVLTSAPAALQTLGNLDLVTVGFDRPIDTARSSVHVEVAGAEVHGSLSGDGESLRFTVANGQRIAAYDTPWPGRVVLSATGADGAVAHHDIPFTYLARDTVYATVGTIPLHLPSRVIDMIGYHESMHPGAQAQAMRSTSVRTVMLPSRNRGTHATGSSDVVADPRQPVLAPATGTVLRASDYVLYCRYGDEFAVISPDEHPAWEVKILHVRGLQVSPGDRVIGGQTVIAAGPRQLPFSSQVDRYSSTRWPHVHVEVVDPSIPPRPGSGC
jgi:putative cell wall-binding protein